MSFLFGGYRSAAVRALIQEWEDHPKGRPELYWRELLRPDQLPYHGDWCGALVLHTLRKVGLAKGVPWIIGEGFIWPLRLPRIQTPQPGDILVVPEPFQHQAMVVEFEPMTGMVTSIDGNQPDIRPKVRFIRNGNIQFYSIQPLIDAAERGFAWGAMLAGAALLGAGAWIWLNGVPQPVERQLKRLGL